MLAGRRVLAVVPARGGSKGLPGKNLKLLLGIPLVVRVADLTRELDWLDRAVVSTDDEEIAAAAQSAGLDAPFRRPAELAADRVGDAPVLVHALHETERLDGSHYDVIVMLQPTSPLRRAPHVERAVRALIEGDWDAVWTVSLTELKYHPLKQLRRTEEEAISLWDSRGSSVLTRQELMPVYHRNGAAYAVTRDCLLATGLMGARTGSVVIAEPMVSIDTATDLSLAEDVLRTRHDQGWPRE